LSVCKRNKRTCLFANGLNGLALPWIKVDRYYSHTLRLLPLPVGTRRKGEE
jgi:hypothetical protein